MKKLSYYLGGIICIAVIALIYNIFDQTDSETHLRQVPAYSAKSPDAMTELSGARKREVDGGYEQSAVMAPVIWDAAIQVAAGIEERQVQIRTRLQEVLAGHPYEVRKLYCADNYCILKVVGDVFGNPNGKTEEEQFGPFNLQKIEPASECSTTGGFKDETDGARGIATVFYYDSTNEIDCFERREDAKALLEEK